MATQEPLQNILSAPEGVVIDLTLQDGDHTFMILTSPATTDTSREVTTAAGAATVVSTDDWMTLHGPDCTRRIVGAEWGSREYIPQSMDSSSCRHSPEQREYIEEQARSVRSLEKSEVPVLLALLMNEERLALSLVRDLDEEWKEFPNAKKNMLVTWVTDCVLKLADRNAVFPAEAPRRWKDAFDEALQREGEIFLTAEVEPTPRRFLHHHSMVREANGSKGHREAPVTDMSHGLEPDPTRVGMVIAGDDEPKTVVTDGATMALMRKISESDHAMDIPPSDPPLSQLVERAERGEPVESAPFVKALGIPCVVLEERV